MRFVQVWNPMFTALVEMFLAGDLAKRSPKKYASTAATTEEFNPCGSTSTPSQLPPLMEFFKGYKNQIGRKRKQIVSSSGPTNSSGTTNTTGSSPSSTPLTHTPGDAMSMPALHHNDTFEI
ncbi:unnamed protein product [Vicia faba]|nr:unnamed protein product [Vicia faba]